MGFEEDVLRTLREIKEAQLRHETEWRAVVARADQDMRAAIARNELEIASARKQQARSWWKFLGFLLLLVLALNYLPTLISWLPGFGVRSGLIWKDPPPELRAFDGDYRLDTAAMRDRIAAGLPEPMRGHKEAADSLLRLEVERYENFHIRNGVIESGRELQQQFNLFKGTVSNGVLRGWAVWHEDVLDPGDCSNIELELRLEGDELRFTLGPGASGPDDAVILERVRP
jgi:hypothetical protein